MSFVELRYQGKLKSKIIANPQGLVVAGVDKIKSLGISAGIRGPVGPAGADGPVGPQGPAGALGTQMPNATDASFNMLRNATIFLPPAILSSDKTITIPAGIVQGDYIKIYNAEAGFSWLLAGALIYQSDETPIGQLFAQTNYFIEYISGKWRILN